MRLSAHELNAFQSLHFVQLFNLKERNTQGRTRFFHRPEKVNTQRLFSYNLENAKESVRPVVSMCKTLKGMRNGFLQVETEPQQSETLAASSGRNIANCLLKQYLEPEKRMHIDERSQQLFASTRSTCVQWGIPATTAAEKSVPASISLQG